MYQAKECECIRDNRRDRLRMAVVMIIVLSTMLIIQIILCFYLETSDMKRLIGLMLRFKR